MQLKQFKLTQILQKHILEGELDFFL